jgi:hypothetical protein
VHGVHTSLKNQIEDKNPQPGDYVGVLFQGLIHRDDADDFYGYRLRVERNGANGEAETPDPQSPDKLDDADQVPF